MQFGGRGRPTPTQTPAPLTPRPVLKQWCNGGGRKDSQQECEAAYVLKDDGLSHACVYDGADDKPCGMAASGEDCST